METRDRSHDFEEEFSEMIEEEEVEEVDSESEDEGVRGTPADIARKHSLQRTSVLKGLSERKRTRKAHGSSTKMSTITAIQRVNQFPGELLKNDCSKLVCTTCYMEIGLKKSVIRLHLKSERHKRGKEARQREVERQFLVKTSFEQYQKRHCQDGEMSQLAGTGLSAAVDIDVAVKRIETVQAFMKAGIPLKKLTTSGPYWKLPTPPSLILLISPPTHLLYWRRKTRGCKLNWLQPVLCP